MMERVNVKSEAKAVDKRVLKLVSDDGFDEVFFETKSDLDLPGWATFKILNRLYELTYGVKKYSSYDSYRVVRNRRFKNRC